MSIFSCRTQRIRRALVCPHACRSLLLAAVVTLQGCASLGGSDPQTVFGSEPPTVELTEVPYFPQEALQCGPAALAEMLVFTGVDVTPASLEPSLFIPAREGTLQLEIVAQARRHGRVPFTLAGDPAHLVKELEAGNPVLVFQNLGLPVIPVWHYAVLVGYDAASNRMILRSGLEERRALPLSSFLRTWNRGERWAITITDADAIPATATPAGWLKAVVALEESGQKDTAETAYTSGRERWPSEPGFHLALTNLHHEAGTLDAAERAARRGLREAGRDRGVLWNNLAIVLAEQYRWDEAIAAAQQAVAAGGKYSDTFQATLMQTRCRGRADCLRQLPSSDDGS